MKLKIFFNPYNRANVNVGERDGTLFFIAKEVCEILGYSNTSKAISDHTDDCDRYNETLERGGSILLINESGLYSLILRSHKPEAKKFKKWVTSELLPTIRKHGVYATEQKLEEMIANPDFAIKLLETIKTEREEKQKALNLLQEQAPRIAFAERLQKTEGTLSIRDYAKLLCDKGLPLGEKRLFEKLRNLGILMRDNKPYQYFVDIGVLSVKEGIYTNSTTGDDVPYMQVRVTTKGQEYLFRKLNPMPSVEVA